MSGKRYLKEKLTNKIILSLFIMAFVWVGIFEGLAYLEISSSVKIVIKLLLFVGTISYFLHIVTMFSSPLQELSAVMIRSKNSPKMELCQAKPSNEIRFFIEVYNAMATRINEDNENLKILNEDLVNSEEILQKQYDELLRSKNEIAKSEERYRSLFELTTEGLFDIDKERKITYHSTEFYESLGVDVKDSNADGWKKLIHREDIERYERQIEEYRASGEDIYRSDYRIIDRDGNIRWISSIGKGMRKDNNKVSLVGVHRDITEMKKHEEEILKMAYTDSLTGLYNRLQYERSINDSVDKKKAFVLMYIDIDSFKIINDTYGHDFGDTIIIHTAKRLQSIVEKGDQVFRLSGDEFGVLSTKYTKKEEVHNYSKYILDQLSMPYRINHVGLSYTASMGVSMFPDDGNSLKDLLVNVDVALYQAKESTKTSYRLFEEKMRIQALEKANLENHLSKSLELNEISVHYQPVINLEDRSVKGFEALVRWKDSEYGNVPPDTFIPIAEKIGYIYELGDFVLKEAIVFAKSLQERYKTAFTMNVNVSPLQLHKVKFIEHIQELLVEYQFPSDCLNLEITESLALDLDKNIISKLAEIRKMGIGISIDDFGTGYSSLNSLVNLSVSDIKIDKSLVHQAASLKEVRKLIRGVVEFAHALDLKVVAEGIESIAMESIIIGMQIDHSQGYYYSRPLTNEKIIEFLDERENYSQEHYLPLTKR